MINRDVLLKCKFGIFFAVLLYYVFVWKCEETGHWWLTGYLSRRNVLISSWPPKKLGFSFQRSKESMSIGAWETRLDWDRGHAIVNRLTIAVLHLLESAKDWILCSVGDSWLRYVITDSNLCSDGFRHIKTRPARTNDKRPPSTYNVFNSSSWLILTASFLYFRWNFATYVEKKKMQTSVGCQTIIDVLFFLFRSSRWIPDQPSPHLNHEPGHIHANAPSWHMKTVYWNGYRVHRATLQERPTH